MANTALRARAQSANNTHMVFTDEELRGFTIRSWNERGFDNLFGGAENTLGEQIIHAMLDDLHTFNGYLFCVLDDEKLEKAAETIGKYGVFVLEIVRPRA